VDIEYSFVSGLSICKRFICSTIVLIFLIPSYIGVLSSLHLWCIVGDSKENQKLKDWNEL
jgi:hypothetical protein